MARQFTKNSFTIDHESWFKDNFGFMPTQNELELLLKAEPGAERLLLAIFSENYLQKNVMKGKK